MTIANSNNYIRLNLSVSESENAAHIMSENNNYST